MFKNCCQNHGPFVKLLIYGFSGAVFGLIGGFVLGLLIWGMQWLVCHLDSSSNCNGLLNVATFLGSGAGAVLGAIFGGISALKKK